MFLKNSLNTERFVDTIFSVVRAAKNDPAGINATAGCLYDETGKLFTFESVNKAESSVSARQRCAYSAAPQGNPEYLKIMTEHVLDGRVKNNYISVGTAGGTGAMYMAITTCLSDGDTIIYPEISWGNYKVLAAENNLKSLTYDVYDLNDLFRKIDSVSSKIFLVVNSPCQNPLGHSYSLSEWKDIIGKLNTLHKEVILVCDIAYIDFASGDPKAYFSLFNDLSRTVMVILAASFSKSFSYYGQRLGLFIAINNDREFLNLYENLLTRKARATWSSLNNGGMIALARTIDERKYEYLEELEHARSMLRKRLELFVLQADECRLKLYKPKDGFFVTVRCADNKQRDEVHEKLMNAHIYTIKVNKGIRVALCSVPLNKVNNLAARIKELM